MGNATSSSQEGPQEESRMSEMKDNLKEKVEDAKESISEGVDEVRKRTSNVLKAVKGEPEENNTGSKVLVALVALGFAWGSGYFAAKDDVPGAALLGGETPPPPPCIKLLSKQPSLTSIWLQSSHNSPSRPGHRLFLRRTEPSLQEVVVVQLLMFSQRSHLQSHLFCEFSDANKQMSLTCSK